MLKLLAVQVQKECKEYIMRCLEPGMMYYLCNDYEITQSDNGIWQVSKGEIQKLFRILSIRYMLIVA